MTPCELDATAVAAAIRRGEITSEEAVRSCLERINAVDGAIQAWAHLDAELALGQARDADVARREGKPLGPLHGVPVALKDIFDTKDLPTEDGTVLHSGRRPILDSTPTALLRASGAVVLGKTVTTELATFSPGKTRNPHNPEHTPGGSSSGSAAAVASHMVPLALGSQTAGSTIRPASFCGIVGYKPTFGRISRHGVLLLSRALDHVGLFGRTVADVALLAGPLMAFDAKDPDMQPRAVPDFVGTAGEEPPVTPRLAFVKGAGWDEASEDVHGAFAELVETLGANVVEIALPEAFSGAIAWHRTIMNADLAHNLVKEYERGKDKLSARLCEMIEDGQRVRAVDYNDAVERAGVLNVLLDQVFKSFDAILTPAALGEAPAGLGATGSPIFCATWTLLGTPALSLPLFTGSNGLPIGAQLVGSRGDDARLMRVANWLCGIAAA